VLPTMMGTSFGNEDSEGKDLGYGQSLHVCCWQKEEKYTWIESCRCKADASLDCAHLHRRSCSSIETCRFRRVGLLFLCRLSGFLVEWRICRIDSEHIWIDRSGGKGRGGRYALLLRHPMSDRPMQLQVQSTSIRHV
jgi:hypothetical protein